MYDPTRPSSSVATTWGARLLVAGVWAVAWLLTRTTLAAWSDLGSRPLSPDAAVGFAVTALGASIAAYLALTSIPLVVAHRRAATAKSRWLRTFTPQAWRKVVGVAVGGILSASVASGAFAAGPLAATPALVNGSDPASTGTEVTSAGWVDTPGTVITGPADEHHVADFLTTMPQDAEPPDKSPPATPQVDIPEPRGDGKDIGSKTQPLAPSAAATPGETVTVRRGDSLWVICADLLPPAATDSDIARAWPLLYRANKAVIGDNPSLIYAGQTLAVPAELRS